MFKYILLLFVLVSCQTKINNPPVNINYIQNMPLPSTPKVEPKKVLANQTFKGDFWELEASPEWKQVAPGGAELALFTQDETSLALLQKNTYHKPLKDFADMVVKAVRATGANATIKRKLFVNTRDAIEIETIMGGGVAWSWVFVFNEEGYSFTCGGEISKFDYNRSLCLALLSKLYIGKAP